MTTEKVYIVIVAYPYEFSKILGVFNSPEEAEVLRAEADSKDSTIGFNGKCYNEYEVEEHELK